MGKKYKEYYVCFKKNGVKHACCTLVAAENIPEAKKVVMNKYIKIEKLQ